MASPFSFNVTKPQDTDVVSQFPSLHRGDKTTIGGTPSATAGVLGTLSPLGTPTTGWRENQVNDDDWQFQNAWLSSTTQLTRDNTAKALLASTKEISGPYFRWLYNASGGADPITLTNLTELLRLSTTQLVLGAGMAIKYPDGTTQTTATGRGMFARISVTPNSTSNTNSILSTGQGVSGAPATSGKVLIAATAYIFNNGTGNNTDLQIYRSTSATPALNVAPAGGDVGVGQQYVATENVLNYKDTVTVIVSDTGLTLGTTYFYYLTWKIEAGTTTLSALDLTVMEAP